MSIGAKFILLAAVLCTSGFTQTAAANLRDSSKPFEDERHHGRRAVGVEGAAEESTTRPTPTKKTRALSTASYTGTNTWGSGSWACRGAGGAGAPNDPNWNLYFDLATGSAQYSSSACQAACDAASTNCVGYEFSAQYARCELWKVPITDYHSLTWGDFDCMTKAQQMDMCYPNSCGVSWATSPNGSCFCDDVCKQYNDCCTNYDAVC
jgi:hypothetical protein